MTKWKYLVDIEAFCASAQHWLASEKVAAQKAMVFMNDLGSEGWEITAVNVGYKTKKRDVDSGVCEGEHVLCDTRLILHYMAKRPVEVGPQGSTHGAMEAQDVQVGSQCSE